MQKLNLRELKGAPLSIILAVAMAGNRPVSVSYLCTETGYSDKTVNNGIDLLCRLQILTQTGRCRFQLTGQNYQLPLYWDEKTEPADPSPAFGQAMLPGMESIPENFSGTIFDSGKFPGNGKTPNLEKRIAALEKRVAALESRKNSVIEAEIPEILPENGEIPDDTYQISNVNTETEIKQSADDDREKIRNYIATVNQYYLQADGGYYVFPDYAPLTEDLIDELAAANPEPEIVEYLLPRTSSFKVMMEWAKLTRKEAKRKLLQIIGIGGKMGREIIENEDITLFEIDYHFWNWQEHKAEHPNWTIGTVGSRIIQRFDKLNAKMSDPLKFNWINE